MFRQSTLATFRTHFLPRHRRGSPAPMCSSVAAVASASAGSGAVEMRSRHERSVCRCGSVIPDVCDLCQKDREVCFRIINGGGVLYMRMRHDLPLNIWEQTSQAVIFLYVYSCRWWLPSSLGRSGCEDVPAAPLRLNCRANHKKIKAKLLNM